jgi:hypothetical protein
MNKEDTLLDRVYSDLLDLTITDENLKCANVNGKYEYNKEGTIALHIPVNQNLELISEARILQAKDHVEVRARGIIRSTKYKQIEPSYKITSLAEESTIGQIEHFPRLLPQGNRWHDERPFPRLPSSGRWYDERPPEMPGVFPRQRHYYPLILPHTLTGREYVKGQAKAFLLHSITAPLVEYCQKVSKGSKLVDKGETIVYTITPESFQKAAA